MLNHNTDQPRRFEDDDIVPISERWIQFGEEMKDKEFPLLDPEVNELGVHKSELQKTRWKKISSAISSQKPESIEQFFLRELTEIYEAPEKNSLLLHPENYRLFQQSLKEEAPVLTANWYGCTDTQRDIVFCLYMHEVIAVLMLWELNQHKGEYIELYLPILSFLTKTASSRYQWVSAFDWSPEQEKETENDPPFTPQPER